MKKLSLLISAVLIVLSCQVSIAQCFIDIPPSIPPPQGGSNQMAAPYDSKYGWYMPTSGEVRVLFVLYEVNYTGGTDPTPPNGTAGWPAHQLPIWANQIAEAFTPTGTSTKPLTQYFQLASSGNYIVLGDYLLAPNNGGIFSVNSSTGSVGPSQAITAVNAVLGTSIVTGNGFNTITDFDKWTIGTATTGPGQPKINPSTESPAKYDHVMFICRNSAGNNGTGYASWALPANMLGFQANTHSSFGAYDGLPFNIIRHEFSHMIYGGNNFHCGGGGTGPANYFIPLISGWSNMSLYNGSLNSWNAWDRLRLDWKAPGNVYSVSARNAVNTAEADGDLDATNPSQAGTYTLRDFVLTGDALRIKLPFTDPNNEFDEWLWIENHQGKTVNGVEFDKWQYEGNSCITSVLPGLYMYQQVDKEIRVSNSQNTLFGGYADYLRPITADGFWDREIENTLHFNPCISWSNTYPFKKTRANPLTGATDQEWVAVDLNNNSLIDYNDNAEQFTEDVNGTFYDNLFILGHSHHAFTLGGNKKIGIGTNPTSANMMNLVSYNFPPPTLGIKNLRKVYLNGVSVEILSQSGGNIQVQVMFDDVDINNDVRWCGDEIVLNPISSPAGYSLNLKTGKTITLSQGYTATRMDNPQTINGKKVFASPTLFSVKPNAIMHLEANSNLILEEGSTLHFETTSMLTMEAGSVVRVKSGCKLILDSKSTVINNGGRIIVEDGGTLEYQEADITLSTTNSTLEIAGLLDLKSPVSNPFNTFTFTGNGHILFNSALSPSNNVTCTPGNCIFKLVGGTGQLLLVVTQESLRLPVGLANFIIEGGVCQFTGYSAARVLGTTTKTILNATTFTSTSGSYNTHLGLMLYGGQAAVSYSTFLNGYQGIRNLNGAFTVEFSTFQNCGYGIFTDGGNFDINNSLFNLNRGFGINADNMTLPCFLTSNEIANTTLTNGIGVCFDGSLSAALIANNNFIHDNKVGMQIKNTMLSGSCNKVNNNQTNGIELNQGASLDFSGNPNFKPSNEIYNNNISLKLSVAKDLFLADGYNNLIPVQSGPKNAVNGTIKKSCPNPPVINAPHNAWNSNGTFTSSDYSLTTVAGQSGCTIAIQLTINDNTPSPFASCNSLMPFVASSQNPLYNCNNCETVYSTSFYGDKLNDVGLTALQQTTEAGGSSDAQGVGLFNEMLMYNLPAPDEKEKYILNYSYSKMGTALGAAFLNNEISVSDNIPALSNEVQQMTDVLNKQLAEAISNGNMLDRFYYSLDKVNVFRLAGRRDLAFTVLDDMYNWTPVSDELDYLNYKNCVTHLEQDLIDSIISADEYLDAVIQCAQQASGLRVAATSVQTSSSAVSKDNIFSEQNISVTPNPATDNLDIYCSDDQNLFLVIKDLTGREIHSSVLNSHSSLDCSSFAKGVYTLQLFDKENIKVYMNKVLLR